MPREQVQASTSEPAKQSLPPYGSGLVHQFWLHSDSLVFDGGGGAGEGGGGRLSCPAARLTPRTSSRCRNTDMTQAKSPAKYDRQRADASQSSVRFQRRTAAAPTRRCSLKTAANARRPLLWLAAARITGGAVAQVIENSGHDFAFLRRAAEAPSTIHPSIGGETTCVVCMARPKT